jgi:hypothetical protein
MTFNTLTIMDPTGLCNLHLKFLLTHNLKYATDLRKSYVLYQFLNLHSLQTRHINTALNRKNFLSHGFFRRAIWLNRS